MLPYFRNKFFVPIFLLSRTSVSAVILFFWLSFIAGCQAPENPPVFRNIEDVKVSKIDAGMVVITGIARFHNPNKMGMKLKKVDVDVLVDGKKVAHVDQTKKTKITPNSDFLVPFVAKVDMKKIDLVSGFFSVLAGKNMKAEFVGNIRINKSGFGINVPVKHTEALRIKL